MCLMVSCCILYCCVFPHPLLYAGSPACSFSCCLLLLLLLPLTLLFLLLVFVCFVLLCFVSLSFEERWEPKRSLCFYVSSLLKLSLMSDPNRCTVRFSLCLCTAAFCFSLCRCTAALCFSLCLCTAAVFAFHYVTLLFALHDNE